MTNEMKATVMIPVRARCRRFQFLRRPVALALAPAAGLDCIDEEKMIWQAEDGDPQFQFERQDGAFFLPAGTYRLRMRLQVDSGILEGTCLYPVYSGSDAYREETSIPLHMQDGKIDRVFKFSSPVVRLRFDPSIVPARFSVGGVELSRLGAAGVLRHRLALFWKMLLGFRNALKKAATIFISSARQHGIAYALNNLHARYKKFRTSLERSENYYSRWIELYDSASDVVPLDVARSAPLISVLLPVYNTPLKWLEKCIDSVLAQAWPHWELCIVDDASTDEEVRKLLASYAGRDARIRIHLRESNGHIAVATNDALHMASGEFIVLLDHDDELRPHSLLEVVKALDRNENLDFIYSDEDKMDEMGRRSNPYFKPDWNPDLLLSQNYICHMVAIRRMLALEVGGVRAGYEGSQDYDLFLRCTARIDPSRIHHIPKILYHWRAIAGSTASGIDAKSYALEAGLRAIADHLEASGSGAKVALLPNNYYRVTWPIPAPAPKVSLIIPTRDRVDLLKLSVGSILEKTRYPDFQIVIADNQSREDDTLAYFEQLRQHPKVRIIPYDAPFNYSAINNHVVRQLTDTDVVGLVNNDVEVIDGGWLDEMVSHAIRPGIGAVGAMLYYPDDTIQHAGVVLGIGGVAGHIYCKHPRGASGSGGRALLAQNLSAVTAACLLVKRERYLECGGLDEDNLKVAFNDVDFCLRLLAAGYRNVWTPFAELYHHESATRGYEDTPEKKLRFAAEANYLRKRWGEILDDDPAYNPNLELSGIGSGLAFPPRVRK